MKKIEYELKILNINIKVVEKKLDEIWAKKQWVYDFKRYVYDFSPVNNNKWIRLRTNGYKTSLTIKEIHNDNIDGTHELEVEVSDFQDTHTMLKHLWYSSRSYQENRRISYVFKWINIEIDIWPMIPPYVEIEWESESQILEMAKVLWYDKKETTSINTKKVYKLYDINLDDFNNLTF